MKKKLPAMIALIALLMCMLGGAAFAGEAAEPIDTLETELRVEFQEMLVFFEVAGKTMDINFGSQDIPTGDTELVAKADNDHILYIADRRLGMGSWSVDASISTFEGEYQGEGDVEFAGLLRLYDPALTYTEPETTLEPVLIDDEYIRIGLNTAKVADGTKDVPVRDFQLEFTRENTRLFISADQATLVRPTQYAATVTWTLTSTVP